MIKKALLKQNRDIDEDAVQCFKSEPFLHIPRIMTSCPHRC